MTLGDLSWEDREYRNVREPQLRRSVDCAGMVGEAKHCLSRGMVSFLLSGPGKP